MVDFCGQKKRDFEFEMDVGGHPWTGNAGGETRTLSCLRSSLDWLYSWLHTIHSSFLVGFDREVDRKSRLAPKRFIDLTHRLLLHRR